MDTTQEYIKMCEKAEEIQKEWKPSWGDFFTDTEDDINNVVVLISHLNQIHKQPPPLRSNWRDDFIWLPRQDQLQGMIYKPINTNAVCAMFEEVSAFGWSFPYTDNSGETEGIELTSGEQLWLAFVMKEKYNKTWDSEKEQWVK